MKKTLALITLLLAFPTLSFGKVVVVPMIESLKVKNVITVAKSGGDFTDIADALDSIKDPSPENPYLVQIGPGEFITTRTLVVENDVTLAGSGTNATLIQGDVGGFTNRYKTVIQADFNTALTDFTVVARGNGGGTAAAIVGEESREIGPEFGAFDGMSISNVNIRVGNANNNFGIHLIAFGFNLYAENVSIDASGSQVFGIANNSVPSGNLRVNNSDISVSCNGANPAENCSGIKLQYGFLWLSNSSVLSKRPSALNTFPENSDFFEINEDPGAAIYVQIEGEIRMSSSVVSGQIIIDQEVDNRNGCTNCTSEIKIYNSTVLHRTQGSGNSICLNTNDGNEPLNTDCLPFETVTDE